MSLPTGRVCSFCKHTYMNPCDGKSSTCPNAMWLQSGRDIEKYKRMADKLFTPKPKEPERIDEAKPTKKGRVRL